MAPDETDASATKEVAHVDTLNDAVATLETDKDLEAEIQAVRKRIDELGEPLARRRKVDKAVADAEQTLAAAIEKGQAAIDKAKGAQAKAFKKCQEELEELRLLAIQLDRLRRRQTEAA